MIKNTICELRKSLIIPVWLFSVILLTASFFLGAAPYAGTNYTIIELIMKKNSIDFMSDYSFSNLSIIDSGVGVWSNILFPLLVGICFSYLNSEEYKMGVGKFYLIRTNKYRYCFAKLMTSIIVSALTMLAGFLIYAAAVNGIFPSIEEFPEEIKTMAYESYGIMDGSFFTYLLKKCVLVCLLGIAYNVFAFATSIFFTDKYVIMCLPILLSYLYSNVLQKLGINYAMNGEFEKLSVVYRYQPISIFRDAGFEYTDQIIVALIMVYIVLFFLYVTVINRKAVNSDE